MVYLLKWNVHKLYYTWLPRYTQTRIASWITALIINCIIIIELGLGFWDDSDKNCIIVN